MPCLLRAAVGTVQAGVDTARIVTALSFLLDQYGWQTQTFCYRSARTSEHDGRHPCGFPCRFLDSWLMTPELGREYFQYSAGDCEVALVAGRFQLGHAATQSSSETEPRGGTLEDLCDWLDLPRLVVLNVQKLADCQMPPRPPGVVGLLLDAVPHGRLAHWRTTLESLWGVPVIGALSTFGTPEDALHSSVNHGEVVTALASTLSDELGEYLRFEQLLKLFESEDLPTPHSETPHSGFYRASEKLRCLTVAVAYDEAFYGYFPGVLDALELHGATVVDFSPLHDETLPPGTDIVYLGGGNPLAYASKLAANPCLISALRSHVCRGGRVYAEGGGLAYLCESIRMPLPSSRTGAGQHFPMAGIFPAVAIYHREAGVPRPVEVTLSRDHWLGPAGSRLRGYRDSAWRIEPFGSLASYAASPGCELDLVERHRAIGSRLQLNFAAQPEFLQRFLPLELEAAKSRS